MIFSDSDDTTKLPLQYIPIHDYCCNLIMDIIPFLTEPKYEELAKLSINFDKKYSELVKSFTTVELLDWLKANGHRKEYDNFFLIYVFKGILADFTEYIEFSLIASRRSRLNVALNLIRKPFLENLIVLEKIFLHPEDFVNSFTEEEPNKYISVKEADKKELISGSLKKLGNNPFFNAELIYTLRFDKNNPNSYYAISNQAVHLVTDRSKAYETAKQNFNFILIPESNYREFWEHYYNFLPQLLYYAIEIIEGIVYREAKQLKEEYKFRKFTRLIGYLFVTELLFQNQAKKDSALDKFSGVFSIKCPICEKENTIYKSDFHDIAFQNILVCKHCLNDMIVNKKILDELFESFSL